ncbi:MAG TPA: disulfide bond formation protein DsbA [Helicobacteraceae bacterium]|nr:disulfide bond formation protein DsbA [Helicobacteraceae bacterium]
MSLMLKFLATLLLLSSTTFAATDAQIVKFLKDGIGKNPNIISLDIKILDKQKVKEPSGWDAYIVMLSGKAKVNGKEQAISQSSVYFASGNTITPELINIKTGQRLNNTISPNFSSAYYKKENLISGSSASKHKVAIFSDPLCPFCKRYVPDAIAYMKKYPETFAVYYYHFPLPTLHPAAVALTKAAIVAEQQGRKNITLGMYTISIDPREHDENKIVAAFNKTLNTNVKVSDLHSKKTMQHYNSDQNIARMLMVNGTPTVFFDGKKDPNKQAYKAVKVK